MIINKSVKCDYSLRHGSWRQEILQDFSCLVIFCINLIQVCWYCCSVPSCEKYRSNIKVVDKNVDDALKHVYFSSFQSIHSLYIASSQNTGIISLRKCYWEGVEKTDSILFVWFPFLPVRGVGSSKSPSEESNVSNQPRKISSTWGLPLILC